MKKIAAFTALLITLAACGETRTVYVVDSLPNEVTTTTPETTTTKPRPTTTAPRYIPPTNYYTYDEQAYIDGVYDMYNNYIYLSDDELLGIAYTICDTLDTGISIQAVVAAITASMPDMSADTVEFVSSTISSAIYNICPQHLWQLAAL
jgi:hypothetical protein